jgi:hypothetical protein
MKLEREVEPDVGGPSYTLLGKTPLSKKAHKKTHVHRARFNGRPKLLGWPGKRWCSPEPGRAVAFIEGGG